MSNATNPSAFWLVWSPQGSPPTMRHKTRDAADAEAERLAQLNSGKQFYVLQAATMYEANAVRRVELVTPPAMNAPYFSGNKWRYP